MEHSGVTKWWLSFVVQRVQSRTVRPKDQEYDRYCLYYTAAASHLQVQTLLKGPDIIHYVTGITIHIFAYTPLTIYILAISAEPRGQNINHTVLLSRYGCH